MLQGFRTFVNKARVLYPLVFSNAPRRYFENKAKKKSIFLNYEAKLDFEEHLRLKVSADETQASSPQEKISKKEDKQDILEQIESYARKNSNQFLIENHLYFHKKRIPAQLLAQLVYLGYLYTDEKNDFLKLLTNKDSFYKKKLAFQNFPKEAILKCFRNKALYFTEGRGENLLLDEYVILLKCIEGMNKFDECSYLLENIPKSLKKEEFSPSLSLKNYLYLFKVSARLLEYPHTHSHRILLLNLDNIAEQRNFFKDCDVSDIENVLECYEQILNNSIRTNIKNYLIKGTKAMETNLIQRLKINLNNTSTTNKSISNPRILFSIIRVFKKMALNTRELYDLIEQNLIKELNTTHDFLKTFFIGFKYLTNVNHGAKLVDWFCMNYENKKISPEDLRNYEKYYLLEFLRILVFQEICTLYSSLEFKEADGFSYLEAETLERSLKDSSMLKKNTKIYDLILNKVLGPEYFEDSVLYEDSFRAAKVYQILFWIEKTNRSFLIDSPLYSKLNEKIIINIQKNSHLLVSKLESNDNEFNADVSQILTSRGFKIVREYPLLIKSCDIAIPDKKIMIELDGAYHFFLDDLKTSFVSNQFRNLFILLNGWRLIELNFMQWNSVRQNNKMEETLIKQLNSLEANPNYILIYYSF